MSGRKHSFLFRNEAQNLTELWPSGYIVVFKDSATPEQIEQYANDVHKNGMVPISLHSTDDSSYYQEEPS